MSTSGSVLVRLAGKNYAVSGTQWYKKLADGSMVGGPIMIDENGSSTPLWMRGRTH
jgi:hypothetical protein